MARGGGGYSLGDIPDWESPEYQPVGEAGRLQVDTSPLRQVAQAFGQAAQTVGGALEEEQDRQDRIAANNAMTGIQSQITQKAQNFIQVPDAEKMARMPQLEKDLTDIGHEALKGQSPQMQQLLAPMIREQIDRHMYTLGTEAANAANRAKTAAAESLAGEAAQNMIRAGPPEFGTAHMLGRPLCAPVQFHPPEEQDRWYSDCGAR